MDAVHTPSSYGRSVFRRSFYEESCLNPGSTRPRVHLGLSGPHGGIPPTFQRLTRSEFRLLEQLFLHEGCLVPRLELLQAVWGAKVIVESRTVDSHIVRLRRKMRAIGTQDFVIETVWGLGYRFRWVP